jgi:hypothetical protein
MASMLQRSAGTRASYSDPGCSIHDPREVIMTTANHPSKFLVRSYLMRRTHASSPPPTPDEVRRQLGWGMLVIDPKPNTSSGRS